MRERERERERVQSSESLFARVEKAVVLCGANIQFVKKTLVTMTNDENVIPCRKRQHTKTKRPFVRVCLAVSLPILFSYLKKTKNSEVLLRKTRVVGILSFTSHCRGPFRDDALPATGPHSTRFRQCYTVSHTCGNEQQRFAHWWHTQLSSRPESLLFF